jgi:hypothetical protein
MKTDDLDMVLARILGLSGDENPLPPVYAEARARLAEALAGHSEPAPLSVAQIATYASGAMADEELRAFEVEMIASEETFHAVTSALEFLDAVEQRDEVAPAGLVDAVIASLSGRTDAPSVGDNVSPSILTAAMLVEFFEKGRPLTVAQQRMLFADRGLRAEFSRLKQQFAARNERGDLVEMPALAAAADALKLEERVLRGGRIQSGHIKSQQVRQEELEVLFTFDEPGSPPRALLLEGPQGEPWIEPLPAPGADGTIFLIKNLNNSAHALFARLLRDPTATGTFLK